MKQFIISQDLAQGVLDYLKKRPYDEVFVLINAMVTLKEIPSIPEFPKKEILNENI